MVKIIRKQYPNSFEVFSSWYQAKYSDYKIYKGKKTLNDLSVEEYPKYIQIGILLNFLSDKKLDKGISSLVEDMSENSIENYIHNSFVLLEEKYS